MHVDKSRAVCFYDQDELENVFVPDPLPIVPTSTEKKESIIYSFFRHLGALFQSNDHKKASPVAKKGVSSPDIDQIRAAHLSSTVERNEETISTVFKNSMQQQKGSQEGLSTTMQDHTVQKEPLQSTSYFRRFTPSFTSLRVFQYIYDGDLENLKKLFSKMSEKERKKYIDTPNLFGLTPLHMSIRQIKVDAKHAGDHVEVARWLIQNGADPNVLGLGITPLQRAKNVKNREIQTLLRERGAIDTAGVIVGPKEDPVKKKNQTLFAYALVGAVVTKDEGKRKEMEHAGVEALLKLSQTDRKAAADGERHGRREGFTPLQILFQQPKLHESSLTIEILKAGANLNILIDGKTLIQRVVETRNEKWIELLLQYGDLSTATLQDVDLLLANSNIP